MAPIRHSFLEVIRDLLIRILMLSVELKGQLGALKKTRGLEPYPPGTGRRNDSRVENELWEAEWRLHHSLRLKSAPCSYSDLAFQPLQGIFPTPFSHYPCWHTLTAAGAHTPSCHPSVMPLLCHWLNPDAFFQPCTPPLQISQFYLLFKVPFRCHVLSQDFLIPPFDIMVSPLKSYRSLATPFMW